MVETAAHAVGLIEKLNFSNTYWAYYKDIEQYPYFNLSIIRPYPSEISGSLISYNYNRNTGVFECTWQEDPEVKSPTRIFIPNLKLLPEENISIEPDSDQITIESVPGSTAGYLLINPLSKSSGRKIRIEFSNPEAENAD